MTRSPRLLVAPKSIGLRGDPVKKAWLSYRRAAKLLVHERWWRKEEKEARARQFAASLKGFLEAAKLLNVRTALQFHCLGISRRTYFYWVRTVREGRSIRYQPQIDYRLWLVWKSLELARQKLKSDDLVKAWFRDQNPLLLRTGLSPIDLLFNYDIRRRSRVLRILLEMRIEPRHSNGEAG
jgi:hypothetical protein